MPHGSVYDVLSNGIKLRAIIFCCSCNEILGNLFIKLAKFPSDGEWLVFNKDQPRCWTIKDECLTCVGKTIRATQIMTTI